MLIQKCLNLAFTPTFRRGSRCLATSAFNGHDLSVQKSLKPVKDPIEENVRLRRQLALCYRLLQRLDLNEGACNHVTVMAPAKSGTGEVMLLAPGFLPDGATLHWSEVTASSLIGLDTNGNVVEEGCWGGAPELSAACIHLGIRRVTPVKAIMHTHPPYSTAQACLKEPQVLPIHQNSLRFLGRSAYYGDYALPDAMDEGEQIGKSLKDKAVLFMSNHGILTAGDQLCVAFDDTYYLERACMVQGKALAAAGGVKDRLAMMDDESIDYAIKYWNEDKNLMEYSIKHFYSWWNKYVNENSDVFD